MDNAARAIAVLATLVLAACTPPTVAPAPPEARWHAAGNEPFWSVDVEGRQIVFRTPDDLPGLALPARRADDGTDVVFTAEEGTPPFLLRLRPEPCQDSMADRNWSHSATFSHDGKAYVGCAEQVD